MLQTLDSIHPDIDTIVVYTEVELLRYYIKEKLETYYKVNKNYSVQADTGTMYKKFKNDSLVAPLSGERWLITANLDKVGVDSVASMFGYGNGNAITLIFTEKYGNYKKLLEKKGYKEYKQTIKTLYLGRFDVEDIAYLHKSMLSIPKSSKLSDNLLTLLCKNYRYDVDKVMDLFTRMRIGLKISSKQELIAEIGLGGVTAASLTIDLLRIFPENEITTRKVSNALHKYIEMIHDLSLKQDYRYIYNQIRYTLQSIILVKMLIINGQYRRVTRDIPEGFADQTNRIKSLWRFDYAIRNEVSLDRVLLMLRLLEEIPDTFDYEARLMMFLHNYIAQWEEVVA